MPAPEKLAERAVHIDSGHHVVLSVPGADPVKFGLYPNPAVAREKCLALRLAVAALLRTAAGRLPPVAAAGADGAGGRPSPCVC